MPFITDANGVVRFVTELPKPGPGPGPVPVTSGTVLSGTPVTKSGTVAPVQSGIIQQSGTVVVKPVIQPVIQPVQSGVPKPEAPRNIARDDVIRKVRVPPGFPPKPFKLKDYMK